MLINKWIIQPRVLRPRLAYLGCHGPLGALRKMSPITGDGDSNEMEIAGNSL